MRTLSVAAPKTVSQVAIRLADVMLSLGVGLFLLPTFAFIALLILIDSPGPVLFAQDRVGRGGGRFRCYKFRSMRDNSEHLLADYLRSHPDEAENWRIYRKLKRDPRITAVGSILRKSSLDEFPQLINVLRGEMSLVGPRPILPGETEDYGRSLSVYKRVRPGITGLWQVKGRNRLSYRTRVALDRVFVRKRSIALYLWILVATVPAVLLQRGSR